MHALCRIFVFCALAGFALGGEIINGKKTKKKSMEYMASVQDKQGHVCGGFLISEDFVLTAAHCNKWNPRSVVLGTHDLNNVNDTMRYSVEKCIHPEYKDVKSGNDIMLLKLSRKAELDKKGKIKPIKLPNGKMKLKKKCLVAGWGLTTTGGFNVKDLREAEVPVINLDKCQGLWKGKLPANVICAGGYKSKKGFCQGDSGGPLVCNNCAVGVVSFNDRENCNYPVSVPNVYTDVSKFMPWITDVLKKKRC